LELTTISLYGDLWCAYFQVLIGSSCLIRDVSLTLSLCQDGSHRGVFSILSGHTDAVSAVRIFPIKDSHTVLLTGSVDKSIRVWTEDYKSECRFKVTQVINNHQSSINCLATLPKSKIFASGSSDGTVMIWSLKRSESESDETFEHRQTIKITPKLLPLALSLASLGDNRSILAIAGTRNTIQVYVSDSRDFVSIATLPGHEGWIRALDFAEEADGDRDLILASASQDKYIRLWRIHEGVDLPTANRAASDPALGVLGRSLSNKAHRFVLGHQHYSLTFEALLIGHEDWIYTAGWRHWQSRIQLLSASADNSLAIWEADLASGVWVCAARLGEISAQKGSTTATGSTGGFWIGLWSPNGDAVVSLGRTGGWRLWERKENNKWEQAVAVTGHTKEVKDITWSKDGVYLLSTGSDQTTRLHAPWRREGVNSWHEFSRPQIHGYDLNCIDSITENQFISGADEKLLRVFDEPAAVAVLLRELSGIQTKKALPDAATIPVLGLSNKAVESSGRDKDEVSEETADDARLHPVLSTKTIDRPPSEDQLSRHLLWPETEKLYGHGYEISCTAASHDGQLVATACRASSIDHALIRLYDTSNWLEVKPGLRSHSLTVTRLEFSPDDNYLLSVGRDRQWTVFERDFEQNVYKVLNFDPKGHARMILDCSWAPGDIGRVFATAGRDKTVKVWCMSDSEVSCSKTMTEDAPVTALSFGSRLHGESVRLAYGMETGSITVCFLSKTLEVAASSKIAPGLCPSKAISRLRWQPVPKLDSQNGVSRQNLQEASGSSRLAVASDDTSIRILALSALPDGHIATH